MHDFDTSPIKRPTLGILGGGQLGRMSAMAAARLGIPVIIYCPYKNSPASMVAQETIIATYDDEESLTHFCNVVDYISYEFENIPIKTISYIESIKNNIVFPKSILLEVSQDRVKEKKFLNNHGIQTTQWVAFKSRQQLTEQTNTWQSDAIIKTTRFGYDGKGQYKAEQATLHSDNELDAFLKDSKEQDLIIEQCVDFKSEISAIIARDKFGVTQIYGPMVNQHKNHILSKTIIPTSLPNNVETQAIEITKKIAHAVNLIGVLTVEFFVTSDHNLLVNEIAPRTHNSGHWSIDACTVSQFENHVRTVCGMNVGSSHRHSNAQMLNLIGDDIKKTQDYVNAPNAYIHDYGKTENRAGRKMGHITILNKPHS